MKIRKFVATTVAAASLAFGVGGTALATSAGADTTTPSTLPAAFCQKAHDRYVKLVAANQKAKEEYQKARDLQAKLLRPVTRSPPTGSTSASTGPAGSTPGSSPGSRRSGSRSRTAAATPAPTRNRSTPELARCTQLPAPSAQPAGSTVRSGPPRACGVAGQVVGASSGM